jgi:uncharacterized paraquat-inducible protein A
MQGFLTWLLQQNPAGFESIISSLVTLSLIGLYVVPLFFVLLEIYDSYYSKSKILFIAMVLLAVLFLPIFVIMFFNHKKLKSGLNNGEKEVDILMTSNNLVECGSCAFLNKKDNKFCSKCGDKLYYFCEKCNHPSPRTSSFCGECGFAYKKNREVSTKGHKLLSAIGYKLPQLLNK